jgi:hypothetical protein
MFILDPVEELKIKWYKTSYLEGDYIIRKFGFYPISIDDLYFYFVETDEFKKIIKDIPFIIKMWSKIRGIRIRATLNKLQSRRRNK